MGLYIELCCVYEFSTHNLVLYVFPVICHKLSSHILPGVLNNVVQAGYSIELPPNRRAAQNCRHVLTHDI